MTPNYIILHHTATKDGKTVSAGRIYNYHTSWAYQGKIISKYQAERLISSGKIVKKPWADIGYHYLIELARDRYEIICGRMPDQPGAHCIGLNQKSIGVALCGNFDIAPPPEQQFQAGVKLCRYLCKQFNIDVKNIIAHNAFSNKSCPGKYFDLFRFKKEILEL